jgi:hypothetical protein
MNKFFQDVIAEEDAIRDEISVIRAKVKSLEDEITKLKNNDAFFYRQRKYCKFSDGYNCKFTGDCDHKDKVVGYTKIFGIRCFAEQHAREANND